MTFEGFRRRDRNQASSDGGHNDFGAVPTSSRDTVGNLTGIDTSLTSTDTAASQMGQLSISSPPQGLDQKAVKPRRPAPSKAGRSIILKANFFELQFQSPIKLQLQKYNFQISPVVEGSRKIRQIIQYLLLDKEFKTSFPVAVSDYATFLVCPHEETLKPCTSKAFSVLYYNEVEEPGFDEAKKYTVTVSFDQILIIKNLLSYLDPKREEPDFPLKQQMISALNAVVANSPSTDTETIYFPKASKFFLKKAIEFLDGQNSYLIARKGHYASVRSTSGRLLLNLNCCTSAFYPEMNLVRLMKNAEAKGVLNSSFLHGLRVEARYLKRGKGPREGTTRSVIRTIIAIGDEERTAARTKFLCMEIDPQKEISVQDYFRRKHGMPLRFPNMPLVEIMPSTIGASTSESQMKQNSPIWLPPEVCEVLPGQLYRRIVPSGLTDAMLKVALKGPAQYVREIVEGRNKLLASPSAQRTLKNFGFGIGEKMVEVSARILSAPKIMFQSKPAEITDAGWTLKGKTFTATPPRNIQWSFLSLSENDCRAAIGTFERILRTHGLTRVTLNPRNGFSMIHGNAESLTKLLNEVRGKSVDLLLVILNQHSVPIYSVIKECADWRCGIHTICVVAKKFNKCQNNYMANIALKFNLKMVGVNQSLKGDDLGTLKDDRGTMVVGYDVTHPSPAAQEGLPSIVGLVASVDGDYAQWAPSVAFQSRERRELVDSSLAKMIGERLDYWQTLNKRLPSSLLVYRDGVSESQYDQVVQSELPDIKLACCLRYKTIPLPKITLLVVGKRHHTRFFDMSQGTAQNPACGTVVDNGVTTEKEWDFYVQPHKALQGTARPIHYIVLYDEKAFKAEDLEKITHNLSYQFGRATKAVSVCPPAYYADLLCDRTRCYLRKELNGQMPRGTKFDLTKSWNGTIHQNLRNTMFYI